MSDHKQNEASSGEARAADSRRRTSKEKLSWERAGLAIELFKGANWSNFLVFGETSGYVTIFLVASAFLLLIILFLRRMEVEKESRQ